jgi:transcriptional regulator with XRE-family HTH domain
MKQLPNKKIIGTRFKILREKIGLSQTELAEKFNVSASTICGIEKGQVYPPFKVIFGLCLFYNVNMFYIFNGNGSMFMEENPVPRCMSSIPDDQLDFLKNFLDLYEKSELVRFSFQAYFKKYKLENKALIEMDINNK